jgi:hypothetical protein
MGVSGQKIQKTVLEQFKYQNSENVIVKIDFKYNDKDISIFKCENLILSVYKKILFSELYSRILYKLIKIIDY